MGAEAAAIAVIIADAIKANGVVVRVTPENFQKILAKVEKPLIVYNQGGIFSTKHQYLTSYKGLAFFTKSATPIQLPLDAEVVAAAKIYIPS